MTTASADSTMTKVPHNSAPALSADLGTLYVAVSNGSTDIWSRSTARRSLRWRACGSPIRSSGLDARLSDNGSASPTVGTDGDVYFGVLENPFGSNHSRGWLLHFDSSLSQSKTPGAFGWDDTASLVPAQMVPSYQGTSAYLLMAKYNNYISRGGDGQNKLAVLDPNATQTDPVTLVTVMKEVLTIVGPTPDPNWRRQGVVHQFGGRGSADQIHPREQRGRKALPLGSDHEHAIPDGRAHRRASARRTHPR